MDNNDDIDAAFGLDDTTTHESDATIAAEDDGGAPPMKRRRLATTTDNSTARAPAAAGPFAISPGMPSLPCDEVDDLFGITSPSAAPVQARPSRRSPSQQQLSATSRVRSTTAVSSFAAEALHLESIRRERAREQDLSCADELGATPAPAVKYQPLLSDRDILFTAAIMGPASDDGDDKPVFANAPTSFVGDTHLPPANSAEELAMLLQQREDATDLGSASGETSQWPISMHGKTIASVSLSVSAKATQARRAAHAAEHAAEEANDTLPTDLSHGPGISDHSNPAAHYPGYLELKEAKLAKQRSNADVYASLEMFQSPAQRAEHAERDHKKRRRAAQEEAESARPRGVPFSLAQATQSTAPPQQLSASASSMALPPSAALSRVRPVGGVFAGVVCYINGGTETRLTDSLPGATSATSEMSSYHLGSLVKLGGGEVLPFPSRTRMTHVIVEHLSYSKARSEFAAAFVKSTGRGRARPIHFVKPAWVRACMQAGARVREDLFTVMRDDSVRDIRAQFGGR